jgi:hypothetical protein
MLLTTNKMNRLRKATVLGTMPSTFEHILAAIPQQLEHLAADDLATVMECMYRSKEYGYDQALAVEGNIEKVANHG